MKLPFRRVSLLFVLAVPIAMMLMSGVAQAIGPMWMPGFPLRAGTAVIIMWTPVPGATEYKLLKKMDGPDFKEVYKGPVNTYNDVDAPVTKTVEYKVVGVVGGKETDFSPVSTLKGIEPLKPPAFTGVIPAADAITLRWSNPPGSVFFNLYRAEKADGPFDLVGSIQQETYTDRKLDKTKTYFYRVTAVDKNNTESEKSVAQEAKLAEVVEVVEEKLVIRKPVAKGTFAGEEIYEFEQPTSFTMLKNGEIAVADSKSVQFVDKDGKYLRRFKLDPKWTGVGSILADPDDNLLLVFYAEKMIRRVTQEGKVLQEITYPADPSGKAENNPNFVAVDKEKNIWVADGRRFQFIKLDPTGKQQAVYGRIAGSFNSKSITPEDLPALGMVYVSPSDGNIVGVLSMSAQIKVLDPKTSKIVKTWGGVGGKLTEFQGIGGMHFKKDGNILVFDSQMQILKEYTKDFKYIASYADVEPKSAPPKLSADMANTFLYNENLNRLYVLSAMGNKVYMYDMPK